MRISWLGDVLRAAGVQVVEEPGWLTRTANGTLDPIGVLWHHTAAPSSASNPSPALGVCINGRADLPGPLCHALVDYFGVFHLVSANYANHAGTARASGPVPAGSGNVMLIGWEIDYAGDGGGGVVQQMTSAQYDASLKATAAVLRQLGRDASYARGHRETSTTGKIDPSFIDLDTMRADVARLMGSSGGGPSGTPFTVYSSNVNVRPTPSTSGTPVGNLGTAPRTVYVECQVAGQTVTANGYTNDLWSRISSPYAGYVSNVFIQGPASLPVPSC
ncbi:peptidoglycan recognition protein family protein [Nocardioides litoris]|uniref:peptidoglycan recognition protein family protein n=1 Tax=Nocardioides litoris TaxID=1926648 RepID=UPI0011238602|nr:N-acetylmuramoyl-L-alanine amidase [Nocardioides litoris]